MNSSFYSHGKLLLTAEYLVLDGAEALALPTTRGQQLTVTTTQDQGLRWKSELHDGSTWFETHFTLPIKDCAVPNGDIPQRLLTILQAAQELNPQFLQGQDGLIATSTLEFPRDWGLGSSSTLITNIALWAQVNPYKLLEMTFGGSGYDIACSTAQSAITYQRTKSDPIIKSVAFDPDFKENIFFIHLNKKQNSRESIKHYRSLDSNFLLNEVSHFSQLTTAVKESKTLQAFEKLLAEHEERLSKIIKTPTIKSELFSDYPHLVKSLGGWGGDFVMVTGEAQEMEYFKNKGFHTIIPYCEMILNF
ncbi:GHMP kinase [Dokdonia sp. Dokd-P16]|uniref:GYDIA family GHMP kinase n=1 Tax=Dokdonia sp. Dokd-P16 TaxID=2173169 RepID=UPI000D5468C3|nr:GYDIA family GHMP kinase [Dokdonia sp. Dokd-P16]AWH74290.1 GHMP kinase [Dokdonia sp. Dokd-P16]